MNDNALKEINKSEHNENDKFKITVSQVARQLNVHEHTVRIWSDLGILPCVRVGSRGDRRFSEEGVITLLKSN
jgi:excisionase family DNA binding protein